jgi:hypothetical protein
MSAQECLQRHPLSFLYVSFTDHSKKDFLYISFFSNYVLYISFSIHQRSILGMHFAPFYTDINIWNEAVESSDWSLYFLKVRTEKTCPLTVFLQNYSLRFFLFVAG